MIKLGYKEAGDRYLGLSTDTKPIAHVAPNSEFEELDTGGIYKWDGTKWVWYEAAKALDHNRMMLGLGLSYQVYSEKTVPQGQNLIVRFRPGNVNFHHAEKRTIKCVNNTCRFSIWRGFDWTGLAVDTTAVNINQKELVPGGGLALFESYGLIDDATLATRLSGATMLDGGKIFADSTNQTIAAGDEPIISGRHYQPNDDLLLLVENISEISQVTEAEVTYKYNWHEG